MRQRDDGGDYAQIVGIAGHVDDPSLRHGHKDGILLRIEHGAEPGLGLPQRGSALLDQLCDIFIQSGALQRHGHLVIVTSWWHFPHQALVSSSFCL